MTFNVPQDKKDLNIITTARIDAALPTVEGALSNAESVLLCSQVGRLNGQKDEKLSMAPITLVVAGKPGKDAKLMHDVVEEEVEAACRVRAANSVVACGSLAKLLIDEVDVEGKRIFVRVDFHVPQDKHDPNIIPDTARIDAALPIVKCALDNGAKPVVVCSIDAALSIVKYALDNGAKSVVLCSHLGCLNGHEDEQFSMAPITLVDAEQLGRDVKLLSDVIGEGLMDSRTYDSNAMLVENYAHTFLNKSLEFGTYICHGSTKNLLDAAPVTNGNGHYDVQTITTYVQVSITHVANYVEEPAGCTVNHACMWGDTFESGVCLTHLSMTTTAAIMAGTLHDGRDHCFGSTRTSTERSMPNEY